MYEKIDELLKKKGKTMADACRATGISQTAMSNCKKRGSNLSVVNALKMADYLGVPVEKLIS